MADMSYHEFSITKKNGKVRNIVNPSSALKKYQRSRQFELHAHFLEAAGALASCFHGFIPHRNAVTGARGHIGFETTIMFDLVNFFDNIFYEHITDAGVLLNAKDQKHLFHKSGYTAQGFPSSPMLANIAAIPLVRAMDHKLKEQFGKDNYALVIYADDISISFNNTDKQQWQAVRETITALALSNRFEINPKKTRVRFAKYGARKILGLNVTDKEVVATRKTNRKTRAVAQQVTTDGTKGQVLGGLRTWQKSLPPKQYND